MKSVKIGQVIPEKKTFKDYMILNMYITVKVMSVS